jgi:hypothetical protein
MSELDHECRSCEFCATSASPSKIVVRADVSDSQLDCMSLHK